MEAPDFTQRPQSLTKTARLINFALRWIVPLLFWIKRVDFKMANADILPKQGPIIVVGAPHTSLADALFMMNVIRRPYAGIGMAELLSEEWPFIVRRGFELLGHIPIVRGDSESGDLASKCTHHVLQWGQAVVVWPDGQQVRRHEALMWYPGFARFALATGTKICILKLQGVDAFWSSHPDNGNAGVKDINWDEPVRGAFSELIDPNDYESVEELVAAVQRAYLALPLPA